MRNQAILKAQKRFITTDEYHQMIGAGILKEEERVELIGGEIVVITPPKGPHVSHVNRLTFVLSGFFSTKALVSVQNPIHLGSLSEPQPDVAVYHSLLLQRNELPDAKDALLVIEVADTSLAMDRRKIPRYAESGIPEAWIVDIQGKCIEVYSKPKGKNYKTRTVYQKGDVLVSPTIPHLEFAVDDIIL